MFDLIAFILAGGRSSRMGADKAFMDWHGRQLIEHALALARSITGTVRIVGSREKFARYGEVVEDSFRDSGPLAGIHAALVSSASELNLILAVDMPLVEPRFLEHLVSQARNASAVVTLPKIAGRWQPLCAVYRRALVGPAETALRAGRNKIDALFAGLPLRVVGENELRNLAFDPAMFENLNTREEFERFRSRQVPSE